MLIRSRLTKGEEVRFISHLDLARTIERAVRRARLPIAYSQGFSPRAKIAFGSALAVGVTSSGEYVDMELTSDIGPDDFLKILNENLPVGIRFEAAVEIGPEVPTLMSVINRASYIITGSQRQGESLGRAVRNILDSEAIWVERLRKKGTKTVDIRPWIYSLEALEVNSSRIGIALLVQTGSQGNVRPEEVAERLPFAHNSMKIHRSGLFIARGPYLVSPLEVAHC